MIQRFGQLLIYDPDPRAVHFHIQRGKREGGGVMMMHRRRFGQLENII